MNYHIEIINMKAESAMAKTQCLIQEKEAVNLLNNEFPGIHAILAGERLGDIYKIIGAFACFTKELAKKRDLKEVRHCFDVAEKMLHEGNHAVRNAIENVYVFSLASLLDAPSALCDQVKSLLTVSLKREYHRQVSASGI